MFDCTDSRIAFYYNHPEFIDNTTLLQIVAMNIPFFQALNALYGKISYTYSEEKGYWVESAEDAEAIFAENHERVNDNPHAGQEELEAEETFVANSSVAQQDTNDADFGGTDFTY